MKTPAWETVGSPEWYEYAQVEDEKKLPEYQGPCQLGISQVFWYNSKMAGTLCILLNLSKLINMKTFDNKWF